MQSVADRGAMMKRLRHRYSVGHAAHTSSVAALHYATILFERNVRLLHQLALWGHENLKLVKV